MLQQVGANTRFCEYLQARIDHEIQVLMKNTDSAQLHQAQGRAQVLQTLLNDITTKR